MRDKPLSNFTNSFLKWMVLLYVGITIFMLILVDDFSKQLFTDHLRAQVDTLVRNLPDNARQDQLIHYLSKEKYRLFFRVTLLDDQALVIYESQSDTQEASNPAYLQKHEKIIEAMRRGSSYDEHYSSVTYQEMAYITIRFEYSGHTYFLRSSFPLDPIQDLRSQLLYSFLKITTGAFALFCLLVWLLIHRLNTPLTQILTTISSQSSLFDSDKLRQLPNFHITLRHPDFNQLIETLNKLSSNVNRAFRTMMRERNEKDAILSSMIEGVLTIDDEMTVRYINPAAQEILSINAEAATKKPLSGEHLPDLYRLLNEHALAESTERGVTSHEVSLRQSHRTKFLNILIQPSGRAREKLLVLRDETLQYELNEMRKGFVANASHELRTPITIIRGFAETLHDHPDIAKEMLVEITGKIVSNCERMVDLITSLMMLSKIENIPPQELSEIELKKLFTLMVREMQTIYDQTTFHLDLSADNLPILAHRELITIAMRNLIENGVKYSEGAPEITIEARKSANHEAVISISDRGIGMPEEDLPHIFERFYRVDKARTKKTGGYGLGLSIVKTIIDKHMGSIEVVSAKGVGTCCTITLPLYSGQEEAITEL